jgi:hypothetical protein
MTCNTFAGIQRSASAVQMGVIHNVFITLIESGTKQNPEVRMFTEQREIRKHGRDDLTRKPPCLEKTCNSIYEASFISVFFSKSVTNCGVASFFFLYFLHLR